MRPAACALIALALSAPAVAQPRATVREFQQTYTTYPYSDPDPVPTPGRIYPYFRFDGYTDTPVQQAWTVVELENAWLTVRVLPQIGGKVWTAIDKRTGRPFLYDNGVVKFRDIAMRGPWTSGGIEANYGIIGHTPNCATPVDYATREHADGSASVTIGVLDLLTRTFWRLEIALPADAASFTTRSWWQNATPLEQPYYTWMNVGLKAAGGLQFLYPGTHYLGHDGAAAPWPRHPERGADLSYYDQNAFGSYKSYHVVGRHTDFFGAYWHEEDAGMARVSTRDDKPGKKIWIWGLSEQGMIWERLLTDTSGQYVEVQSGRLFNQANDASTRSPFKHRGFAPGLTDTWTEHWFPVTGTRGLVAASPFGGLNVTREGDGWRLRVSPLERVTARVELRDGDRVAWSEEVAFTPLVPWTTVVAADVPASRLGVSIGDGRLSWSGDVGAADLARPLAMPAGFDWGSAQGQHLRAKALMRQREYVRAGEPLEASLARDPHYVPALVDLAQLKLRALDAGAAIEAARLALSVDTYDPGANYYYGLAAAALDRHADARDGFEIAAQSAEYRAAAWHQLARLALRAGDRRTARHYATRAVEADGLDLDARLLRAAIDRLEGGRAAATAAHAAILERDPLNHHARAERFLLTRADEDRRQLTEGLRAELPHETFLELAAWYRAIGRDEDAAAVLAIAPQTAEVLFWRAYLDARGSPDRVTPAARELLDRALAAPLDFVLPFRAESAAVFTWAATRTPSWKPKYLLALVHLAAGNQDAAVARLRECGDAPDFAPFFAVRAAATDGIAPSASRADLQRAAALDPGQWRFGRLLVHRLVRDRATAEAVSVAARYHERFPANYVIGMQHARTLLLAGRARAAADVLTGLRVLPYEGSTEGRHLHRVAQLTLAAGAARAGRPGTAAPLIEAAREWPERLGAGKPYADDLDESLEDVMAWRLRADAAPGDRPPAPGPRAAGAGALAGALTLRDAGLAAEAARALALWERTEADASLLAWGRATFDGSTTSPAPPPGDSLYAPVALLWSPRP